MSFKAALIQMRSGRDMARNLADASQMIRAAKARGAQFIATPEMTNIIETDRPRLLSLARSEREDACVAGFATLARELRLWLNVGSLALKGQGQKLINRSLLLGPDGRVAARYDKIHLFDVDLPGGEPIRESAAYEGGGTARLAALPWGGLGLTVCYDIRFPALYLALAKAGAGIFTVPSAFTVPTGEAHWHVLLRARAIETGSFVLAAAQGGSHECGRQTYGHSLAVSPWGEVLAEGGTAPDQLVFDIDTDAIGRARRRIPSLHHGRAFGLNTAGAVAT
ncbi:MAG: carbon-nitrogen hydrolase family protein [Hyphomicrobiales bacterium]